MHISLRRERSFWGPGVAQLLHGIAEKHSLRAAAQQMDMSYSKAWKIIHEAEKGLRFKLIEASAGGMQGGGSRLTPKGEALLRAYEQMSDELKRTAQQEFEARIRPLLSE